MAFAIAAAPLLLLLVGRQTVLPAQGWRVRPTQRTQRKGRSSLSDASVRSRAAERSNPGQALALGDVKKANGERFEDNVARATQAAARHPVGPEVAGAVQAGQDHQLNDSMQVAGQAFREISHLHHEHVSLGTVRARSTKNLSEPGHLVRSHVASAKLAERDVLAVPDAAKANTRRRPSLSPEEGKPCPVNAQAGQKRIGCGVDCRCYWYERCYPMHLRREEGEGANINVGVCELGMSVMMAVSVILFFAVLLCVFIFRICAAVCLDGKKIESRFTRRRQSSENNSQAETDRAERLRSSAWRPEEEVHDAKQVF